MKTSIKLLGVALAVTAAISSAGITGVGRSRGAITAFGSIFVNGIEYQTTNATIIINDRVATEADLRVGQVVTVDGDVAADGVNGLAFNVSFESDVRGVVTAIDPLTSSFTALGQRIRVAGDTVFDASFVPANLGGLTVGTTVEVSGYRNAAGDLVAAFVQRDDSTEERVVGAISGLDTFAQTFNVANLTVSYSGAAIEGLLADGTLVEVKGEASGSTLAAREVETKASGLGAAVGTENSLEGFITRGLTGGELLVDGQRVVVNAATTYTDGTAADLAADVKVQVEGVMDASGRLVADAVVFHWPYGKAQGVVTAVSGSAATLTVNGLTITTNADTRWEDRSNARARNFALATLRVGDTVDVDGFEVRAPRTVLAKRIRRIDRTNRAVIEGTVTAAGSSSVVLIDTLAVATADTVYEDAQARRLTAQQFFQQAAGREVKTRGTRVGTSWVVAQFALKN